MTVNEVNHRDRQNALIKLDSEIKHLKHLSEFDRNIVKNLDASFNPAKEDSGPMVVAKNELKKRLIKDLF